MVGTPRRFPLLTPLTPCADNPPPGQGRAPPEAIAAISKKKWKVSHNHCIPPLEHLKSGFFWIQWRTLTRAWVMWIKSSSQIGLKYTFAPSSRSSFETVSSKK